MKTTDLKPGKRYVTRSGTEFELIEIRGRGPHRAGKTKPSLSVHSLNGCGWMKIGHLAGVVEREVS